MSVLDASYQQKLEELIEKEIKALVMHTMARIDLPTEIGKKIKEYLDARVKTAALPEGVISHKAINWNNFNVYETFLNKTSFGNFTSTGIQDVAKEIELTVADQLVVIENTIVARNSEIKEKFISKEILADKITVNELVMSESANKQFISLIKDTLTSELKTKNVDVVQNPIVANGKEVLNENTLGPSIINSNLRKLGRLSELNVGGIAQFNDTLLVTNTGKVGINTSEPEGALSIWDDDSELTIRKYKKKNMYIGTMRDTDLSFGTNGDVKLALRKDGTVEISQLDINGIKISVANQIPTHVGKPGELILISNAKEDDPWAYRCVGGDRWKAIK